MIRVGIVGNGGISKVHILAYNSIENTKLVAVADIEGVNASRHEIIKDTDVKVYTSLEEMIANEELDLLDVCTPSYLHAEMALYGLNHGLHVICEKPFSRHSEDTYAVIEAAKKTGKKLMIAQVVRFMKPYSYLRSVIEDGSLGKVIHADFKRLSSVPRWSHRGWLTDKALSGGAPIDLSVHDIDFVYSVFGEPRDINGSHRPYRGADSFGLNDYITACLAYEGFSVNITGSFYNADIPFRAEFLVLFENGYVELKDGKVYNCGKEVSLEDKAPAADTGINLSGTSAYTDEIAYFISCIEQYKEPTMALPVSSQASLKLTERIIDCAIEI